MKVLFLFILMVLLSLTGSYGQSPAWKTFDTRSSGISLSLHWMQLNDMHFSPLRYNGPGGELKIVSIRSYDEIRRYFSVGGRADYLWNSLGFNSIYVQPEFVFGLTRRIEGLSGEKAFSYLGGGINATSRIYRFLNEDPDHIYWATSYMTELHYIYDIAIGDNRKALVELKLPLAGIISRPAVGNHYNYQLPGFVEYAKRLHENPQFATWYNMQGANLLLLAELSSSRRSSVSVGYELDFARFSEPAPAIYFFNSVFIRIFYDVFVW